MLLCGKGAGKGGDGLMDKQYVCRGKRGINGKGRMDTYRIRSEMGIKCRYVRLKFHVFLGLACV